MEIFLIILNFITAGISCYCIYLVGKAQAAIKAFNGYNQLVASCFLKQGAVNKSTEDNILILNTKISEMSNRLTNAGTKIIELENAIILPIDKEGFN